MSTLITPEGYKKIADHLVHNKTVILPNLSTDDPDYAKKFEFYTKNSEWLIGLLSNAKIVGQ